MTKLRILIVIPNYLPGTKSGGPVRTISNLVTCLGDHFEFRILTSDHDIGDSSPYPDVESGVWYPVGNASVRYLSQTERRLLNIRSIINNEDFALLYLNGIYPTLTLEILLLRRLNLLKHARVVIAPRGHIERGALSLKPLKKRLFLTASRAVGLFHNIFWHAASETEREDVLREFEPIPKSYIRVISNLAAIPLTQPGSVKQRKMTGNLHAIFLSRISRMKNLDYALKLLKSVHGDVEFDIYGPLEDMAYWAECQSLTQSLPQNVRVSYKGSVPPDEVVSVLSRYHLLLLPTLGENFGHIILESLCAGCPVLISDQTPWNSVQDSGAGWALPLDHPESFIEAIQKLIDADEQSITTMAKAARDYSANYIRDTSSIEDTRRFFTELTNKSSHEPKPT